MGGRSEVNTICFFQLVQGIEGVEHLLLSGVPVGDELHVVHEEHVGAPVFFPEFGVAALSNGLDQLIGEGVPLDVDNLVIRVVLWMVWAMAYRRWVLPRPDSP